MNQETKVALVVAGGGVGVIGLTLLLLKAMGAKRKIGPTPPDETSLTVTKAGYFDNDIGGGWVLLDVRDIRDPAFDPDISAHVGMTASLVLQHQDAPPKVFNAQIIGISGDDYNGAWAASGGPAGGPQAIDFRGANIFTLHR